MNGFRRGEQPSLGTLLYAIVMSEDAIQSETRGIDGLLFGYLFEDEPDDPAARVALSAVVRGDEPTLGVRNFFEWHSEIADRREELDSIAERLYQAMIRLAPAAAANDDSTA